MSYNQTKNSIDRAISVLLTIPNKELIFIDYLETECGRSKWIRLPLLTWNQAESVLYELNYWFRKRSADLRYKNIRVRSEIDLDQMIEVDGHPGIFMTKREFQFDERYQAMRDQYLYNGEFSDLYDK